MTENNNPLATRQQVARVRQPFFETERGDTVPTDIEGFVYWLNSLNFGRHYVVGKLTDGRKCVADVDRPNL